MNQHKTLLLYFGFSYAFSHYVLCMCTVQRLHGIMLACAKQLKKEFSMSCIEFSNSLINTFITS